MDKELELKLQLEAMNKLFVSERGHYIIQNEDGSYTNSKSFTYNNKLYDNVIINHLKRKTTIGVFSREKYTPFVLFDVDMKDYSEKERQVVVNNLVDEIKRFGIGKDFINVSFSGSKGYHIYVHFDNHVMVNYAKKFYGYIIYSCGYSEDMVEYRGCHNYGVKLPLSKNRKTNKICYYVDEYFNKIKDPLHITKIKQFPSWLFQEYVEDIKESKKFENYTNDKIRNFETKIDKANYDNVVDVEKNGLKVKGTRHHYTFKIAMLYNTNGIEKDLAISKLIDWIDNQNEHMYSTKLDTCYNEIKRAVDWVYSNNAKISKGNRVKNEDVYFTKSELNLISSMPTKMSMYILFSLLLYSKQYKDENDEFYLTYGHLEKIIQSNNRNTISKNIENFIQKGIIIKTRQGDRITASKYKINQMFNTEDDKYYYSNKLTIRENFSKAYTELFDINTLKTMFTVRLLRSMIEYSK